jgi:hypothetical protein
MRFALVHPWLRTLGGNRLLFCLARELAREGDEVDLFSHTVLDSLLPEIRSRIEPAKLEFVTTTSRRTATGLDYAWRQYGPRFDRELARRIARSHALRPYDAIVVLADEGVGLGGVLRATLPSPLPLLGLSVMELIDHSFLLGYERSHPLLRAVTGPLLFPILHRINRDRLASFDILFTVSPWTSHILEYLYGLHVPYPLVALDPLFFDAQPDSGARPYIAVPTASLGATERRFLEEVARSGLPLRAYGPNPVPGLDHAGYLPEGELGTFLASARATLFLFDYEALGLIPFESLACGTPVVSLPKQGPYFSLKDNPYAHFSAEPEEVVRLLRTVLEATPPPPRETVRNSVRGYSAAAAAEGFRTRVRDELEARRRGAR